MPVYKWIYGSFHRRRNGEETSKVSRDIIREKILDDWSYERGKATPWNNETIMACFPDWLKNPVYSSNEYRKKLAMNLEKANAAKAKKYQQKIQRQSSAVTRLLQHLVFFSSSAITKKSNFHFLEFIFINSFQLIQFINSSCCLFSLVNY